jgi:hypothetical protein
MLKSISSLKGAKILGKEAQKKINGGVAQQCYVYLTTSFGAVTLPVNNAQAAASAMNNANAGSHWCCASCATASWSDTIPN